jgi:ABC-2 type transport system permease protein
VPIFCIITRVNLLLNQFITKYRYTAILLRQLVITDFKLRYQGSVLGYLWSLLRPLALFTILYIVFGKFLKIGSGVPHYPVYLLLGIVIWNFFIEVTTGNVSAVVNKGDVMRKVNFPKYIIIFAGSFSALINLTINFVVLAFIMAINHVSISRYVLFAPFLVAELLVLSLGVAFLLSSAYVRLRDVGYIWEVVVQAAFYATPVIYPLATPIPDTVQRLLILNPMAQILQDIREVLVTPSTRTLSDIYGSGMMRLVPFAVVALTFVIGAGFFRTRSKFFAEDI